MLRHHLDMLGASCSIDIEREVRGEKYKRDDNFCFLQKTIKIRNPKYFSSLGRHNSRQFVSKRLKASVNIHQLMTSASENIKNVAVSDFMTRKVKVITENETMRQACKLMYQHNIGSIIILKNDGDISSNTTKKDIPVGILTERDIARMIGFSGKFYPDAPVSEVMNKPLITVSPNTSVKDAVALMEQRDIRRLPVVDDEQQMIGIITAKDILKAVMNSFKGTMKGQGLTSEGFDLLGLLGAE